MSKNSKAIKNLYNSGLTYQQYISAADVTDKEKHLHYLNKMEFCEDDKKSVLSFSNLAKLLVFCNISCNDCRIVLAVLENMHLANSSLQYKIVDRQGNKSIMGEIDENCKIPLLLIFLEIIKI